MVFGIGCFLVFEIFVFLGFRFHRIIDHFSGDGFIKPEFILFLFFYHFLNRIDFFWGVIRQECQRRTDYSNQDEKSQDKVYFVPDVPFGLQGG